MPKRVTISRAISVTLAKSSAAPVEISPNTRSSAARPASSTTMRSLSSPDVIRKRSSVGRCSV
ncbi:hypothetical protein D3C72_2340950 [compost metagenome]